MATPKKPAAAITKHKAVTTRKARGEAMDIIPAAKVVPSSTSRPVITPIMPEQPDNTLTQTPTAPLVHKQLVLDPSGGKPESGPVTTAVPAAPEVAESRITEDGAIIDEDPGIPAGPPEVPAVLQDVPRGIKPAVAGRSVADLLSAKQQAAAVTDNTDDVEPAKEAEKAPEAQESQASKTDEPEVTPVLSAGLDSDDTKASATPAAASGKRPLAADKADDAETASSSDKPDAADQPEAAAPAAADSKPADDDKTDSLHSIFTTEEPTPPAEHSPQLKSALADLDKSGDNHPHDSKLYGGKPVIVVHEPHPMRSALKALGWFILLLLLALVVLNFLLDAGVVSTGYELPHTNLLEP